MAAEQREAGMCPINYLKLLNIMSLYHIVKYSGPFGFIKPWTAVRDEETFSQQFLTPSIVEGLEKKLFPETKDKKGLQSIIVRHRLNYAGMSVQQEQVWSKDWVYQQVGDRKAKQFSYKPETGILKRGVLIEPHLYLAFCTEAYAERAFDQHVCLCRNEDLLFPVDMFTANEQEMDELAGFELTWHGENNYFPVGYNRFDEASPMFGQVQSFGDPIRKHEI